MPTLGDKYILGSGRSDHDRLHVISEIHDDRTHELLVRAGFAPGHRFVEFGCGLGYVTRWAAGQGAHATGIDVNPEQVQLRMTWRARLGLRQHSSVSATFTNQGLRPTA
jgi:cyclopropane fatty-acyl-phospholipid synthase-like methyltransferase